uniref:UDP-3-O-[3-hydroxymyristoyl] N-acetylglucosamine deacetylase n=2 Tax=Lygus hesperus TaxID=30085 RepID=A0A0A9WSH1_LYGHE
MKAVLVILLASALIYEVAECSPANFLADKTLAKLSAWIQAEGANWVTLSGHFEKGIVAGQASDNYTLAMAGPAFNLDGSLSRISEATLSDGVPDPNYDSSQKLVFSIAIKNVTVDYKHVAYNDDNNGFFNITSMGTSDGISAVITIDIKGSGDSCMGFADDVTVDFSGNVYVSTDGVQEAFPQVIAAVTNHFKTNVPNAMGLLVQAAAFNSLDGFDICTGVLNPLPQANVMARRIMNAMQDGLNQNIQYWAVLPGFYKTDTDLNGTTLDRVVVRAGNFSSIGTLTRIGEASYDNDEDDLKFVNLNTIFEVTDLTAVYGYMEYVDYLAWYVVGETVTAQKLTVSLTVTYTRPSLSDRPSCVNATVNATTKYEPSGGPLKFTNLTPNVDDYYVKSVNKVLGPAFIDSIEGVAGNLFRKAAVLAFTQVCQTVQ